MSGYFGDLSFQQEEALNKMKKAVSDVHKPSWDDYYYLRWLRAKKFDVTKAETMLRKHLSFRKKFGVDTILKDYVPSELLKDCVPLSYMGSDKEGGPIRYIPMRNFDYSGLMCSVTTSELMKFLVYTFEQDIAEMEKVSKETGKKIEQHSFILDYEGHSFRQATNKNALKLKRLGVKLYEENYPERLKVAYVINAPYYINIVLQLAKAFTSDRLLQMFQICGRDFQNTLLDAIDSEVLPKSLGGSRTDANGDPMCRTIINYGRFIPPEFYITKDRLESQGDVDTITVAPKSFHLVNVSVQEAESVLSWEFQTSNKDIGFGLYYRNGSVLDEILELEQIECQEMPESGSCVCEKSGTYVLKFDNSHSWMFSKKVFYKIKVTTAGEESHLEE